MTTKIRPTYSATKRAKSLFRAVALFLIAGAASAQTTPPGVSPEHHEDNVRAVAGARVILSRVNDPDSIQWDLVAVTPKRDVCYAFRGKNKFNATIRTNAYVLSGTSEVVMKEDSDKFVDVWNAHCAHPKEPRDVTVLMRFAKK